MRGLLGERPWSLEPSEDDLEQRVSAWIERQESNSWIASAIMLGTTFIAMVLFALAR